MGPCWGSVPVAAPCRPPRVPRCRLRRTWGPPPAVPRHPLTPPERRALPQSRSPPVGDSVSLGAPPAPCHAPHVPPPSPAAPWRQSAAPTSPRGAARRGAGGPRGDTGGHPAPAPGAPPGTETQWRNLWAGGQRVRPMGGVALQLLVGSWGHPQLWDPHGIIAAPKTHTATALSLWGPRHLLDCHNSPKSPVNALRPPPKTPLSPWDHHHPIALVRAPLSP